MATICLADNGSTAVKQEASNARIVALSMSPMRCNPAAVSWIAADKRLRCLPALAFFRTIAHHLLQFHVAQRNCNLRVAVAQIEPGQLFQVIQFPVVDVVALALGKAIEEDRALGGPIDNYHPNTPRASAARPGDALLDQMPSKDGIDQS